jgi:hypothetical protein
MTLTTKPRWDKYDPYVGNFRAPLGADIDLTTQANKVLAVGVNSSGAVVVGAGQTGIVGLMIVPVGVDIHGNILSGGINCYSGDVQDVGRHGEITNFAPTDSANTYTVAVTAVTGTILLKVDGVATGTIAYNAADTAVKAALVAVDDGHDAADWTVTGTAPNFVITPPAGVVVTSDDTKSTVVAVSGTGVPVAGTKYYAHADGSVNSTSASGIYVGHTVEATRLIVDVDSPS